ncbi:ParB/RepB/Spo0J family partition protein [Patescibacteria group bacterium]|nr:ParB/RepB/Spo0J family partition protein [Patescibacteria group bacterium]MBU1705890.1 ParB/RepB/Spo0J family partition protein [Patescibacteria group bacterium]
MSKSALGRGLGSLIPQKQSLTEQVIPAARTRVLEIDPNDIMENPRQPRRDFAAKDLEDLVASIKEHGIIQPLVVTQISGDKFELIAGERRWRASKEAGLKEVPVIVRKASDQEKLELALIENIQRQDLNAYEEALAYRALIDEFNLTQEDAAKRVGKSRSAVANILRLLELPEEMIQALREGKITKSHARTLLSEADPKKQRALFAAMLKGDVSVREAESRIMSPKGKPHASAAKDPNLAAHEKKLREILGTKVTIQEKKGKGKIIIEFYSKEELLDLLDQLTG